jgi:molybdate transport system substrate-binding protein
MADRAVQAPPGVPVGALLARGEADLGFQQLSEFVNVPGVEILGPLPPEIQAVTVFSAGVSRASSQPDEARALINYLTSAEAAEVKRRHGMEPA